MMYRWLLDDPPHLTARPCADDDPQLRTSRSPTATPLVLRLLVLRPRWSNTRTGHGLCADAVKGGGSQREVVRSATIRSYACWPASVGSGRRGGVGKLTWMARPPSGEAWVVMVAP